MESNIELLESLKDEYVLFSSSADEYLSHSGTPGSFKEKCEEILERINPKIVSVVSSDGEGEVDPVVKPLF